MPGFVGVVVMRIYRGSFGNPCRLINSLLVVSLVAFE